MAAQQQAGAARLRRPLSLNVSRTEGDSRMGKHELEPGGPRPYFAEIPYYIWGQVNYDSDGDCDRPRSRNWTWMDLENRETGEQISI